MERKCDILLITVTDTETSALFDSLKMKYKGKRIYNMDDDEFKYNDFGIIGKSRVFHARTKMGISGPEGSQWIVSKAIEKLHPVSVIMVGIAFGRGGKQEIGTILVSTQIIPYEKARIGKDENMPRGIPADADGLFITQIKDKTQQINKSNSRLSVEFGPLLSGEKLVDNKEFRDKLFLTYGTSIGGEMEGYGVYTACFTKVSRWVIIKSICDWGEGKKNGNEDKNQEYAAQRSAEYVLELIRLNINNDTQPFVYADANDLLYAGRFNANDPLLDGIKKNAGNEKTLYELCLDRLKKCDWMKDETSFQNKARSVYKNVIDRKENVDLNKSENCILIASYILQEYTKFKKNKFDGSKGYGFPKEFCVTFPNTINSFINDILIINASKNNVLMHINVSQPAIADAAAFILSKFDFNKAISNKDSGAYPEVFAAYLLGRLQVKKAKVIAEEALKDFKDKLMKLYRETDLTNDSKRMLLLFLRTVMISLGKLKYEFVQNSYLQLLYNDYLATDINAGFHLEYYGDKPFDPLSKSSCSDDQLPCENTILCLTYSIIKELAKKNCDINSHSLHINAYTLTTILARRIKSEIRCDLHDSIIVLGWLYDSLENCELKSFIETLLDVDCSVDNDYPARQIGRFFAAKNAPRNGWVTRGIQYPETVGAHTASLIWLCNLISEDDQKDIDVNRIRRMLEIHDLSEGITGDIVKPEKDPKYEQIERDLLRKLSWLGLFMDPVINLFSIYKLYDEFASKNTKEAQLANEIDSIDIVIHANSLLIAMKELINRKAMNELIENERSKVKSAIGKHIMKTALNMQLYSKESFIIDCELKSYIFGETMKNESSVLKIKLDELGLELDDAISILNEMHQLKKEYQEMVIQYIKSLAEKETKSD